VEVSVAGVPDALRGEAIRLIRRALGDHPLESTLHVHAERFNNGEWVVFITDLNEIEVVDGALAERIRAHLLTLASR
jgi:flagellar biosynthesis regulator FlaF